MEHSIGLDIDNSLKDFIHGYLSIMAKTSEEGTCRVASSVEFSITPTKMAENGRGACIWIKNNTEIIILLSWWQTIFFKSNKELIL